MYNVTDTEKDTICPWAEGMLANEDTVVVSNASKVLVLKCTGKYIDLVLDKAEALQKEGKLKGSPFVSSLTNFTFSCKSILGSAPTGTEEQCKRKEALVSKLK